MKDEALVKNAADPEQVKTAGQKEKSRRDRELDDLQALLSQPNGRRFIWRLLKHCRTFESIYHSSSQIYYSSGVQDVGHFIMAEVVESNEDALLLMMKENKRET